MIEPRTSSDPWSAAARTPSGSNPTTGWYTYLGRAMIRRLLDRTMKTRFFAVLIGLALSPVAALAQQPPAADGFVQPRTPWGDPDLQGFWPGVDMVGVPLQRPARFGTRNVLTEEEFAAARPRDQDRGGVAPRRDRRVHRRRDHAMRHPLPDLADAALAGDRQAVAAGVAHHRPAGRPSAAVVGRGTGAAGTAAGGGQGADRATPGARGGHLSRSQPL